MWGTVATCAVSRCKAIGRRDLSGHLGEQILNVTPNRFGHGNTRASPFFGERKAALPRDVHLVMTRCWS